MKPEQQRNFIAEGLPTILKSAQSFISASSALEKFPREIEVLDGHAEEESAKILILMDIMRCPEKRVASRVGVMLGWFYNHLARLIYVKAQYWSAPSLADLQEYVDHERHSHYLEGEYGEFIAPNWEIFGRESLLYADVVGDEHADPTWNSPADTWNSPFGESMTTMRLIPASFRMAEAMNAFGMFTVDGLKIVSNVWGAVEFIDTQGHEDTRQLALEMLERLSAANLVSDRATEDHARLLLHKWQMPMYNINFSMIDVSLEDLRRRRDSSFPTEY